MDTAALHSSCSEVHRLAQHAKTLPLVYAKGVTCCTCARVRYPRPTLRLERQHAVWTSLTRDTAPSVQFPSPAIQPCQ